MAAISETHAALRFYGDDLNPDALTTRLKGAPSSCARKGDVMPSGHVVTTGRWLLRVDQRTPGDLDAQIKEIFSRLTPDLAVWAELTSKYRSDLFLGLMLNATNEGIELGVESIALLAERSISVGLDIYAPCKPANSEPT